MMFTEHPLGEYVGPPTTRKALSKAHDQRPIDRVPVGPTDTVWTRCQECSSIVRRVPVHACVTCNGKGGQWKPRA
ncbi:hypothetical protein D3C86_1338570 [compost metagenome]